MLQGAEDLGWTQAVSDVKEALNRALSALPAPPKQRRDAAPTPPKRKRVVDTVSAPPKARK